MTRSVEHGHPDQSLLLSLPLCSKTFCGSLSVYLTLSASPGSVPNLAAVHDPDSGLPGRQHIQGKIKFHGDN